MSEITVVEFESSTFGNSYVSELSDGPPYTVHGIALGAGDVTVGASGIKKKWPASELEQAADSLRGTNLVVDHNNDATGVVGRVTKAGYKEETGVVYEAELYEEDLAEKVKNGLLEVSIRGYHADVDALEEDEETGAKVVEDIQFDNLSIVPTGAAPSNTLEMGAHAELSAAELSAFTDTLDEAELEEIEPGMWVEWGDARGITISQVQDGEIEVDVYEESDGKWRSTGETKVVDTDSLSEWDVDEDEDIGAASEDSDSDEEEDSEEDEEKSEEENEAVDRGEFVKFKDVDNNWKHGQIISIDQDGAQMSATLRLFTEGGDKLDDTVQKPVQGLDKWDDSPQLEDDMQDESNADPQANEPVSDVGLQDLLRVLTAFVEENAVSTKDTPTEDAEPTHEPIGKDDVDSLLEQFVEEAGEDATIAEFRDWLSSDMLYDTNRGEGEEEPLNSKPKLKESRSNEPRWLDSELEELALSDVDREHKFNTREAAEEFVSDSDLFEGVHKMGSFWIPGETHKNYMNNVAESSEDDEEDMPEEEDTSDEEDSPEEEDEDMTEDEPEEDEEEMATVDDHRHTIGVLDAFLNDSGSMDSSISAFLEWADDDPVVRRSVDEFTDAAEDGSPESEVRVLESWLNDLVSETDDEEKGEPEDEEEEASVNEGADSSDTEDEELDDVQEHEIDGTGGRPTPQTQQRLGGVRVLSGDDLQQGDKSGESDVDSLTTYKVDTMTNDIEEKLAELENPVAVEADEVEQLRDKADRFEEMSENLEALRERTDILDDVDHSQVEELAESDDAVVVESTRYEELQAEAEQVKSVYAASLAEEYPVFDAEELTSNYSIDALREKFEEHIGDVEEELTSSESAEPRSQDADEESLEEASESEEDEEAEELSDQVAEKQSEIRDKILGGN